MAKKTYTIYNEYNFPSHYFSTDEGLAIDPDYVKRYLEEKFGMICRINGVKVELVDKDGEVRYYLSIEGMRDGL